MSNAAARPSLVGMSGITKRFPGVLALDAVDFDVAAGEVHGLVGENGSGKSTLVKILAGRYRADAGEIRVDDQLHAFRTPNDALGQGIAMVAQEVLVQRELTVTENILLGRMPRRMRALDWPRAHAQAGALLAELDLAVDPRVVLGKLPLHLQQMVAIAKMAARRPRLLVLDEPTSSLAEDEVETLFALVARLRAQGVAIVYITHRLREYFALADRVTVLRDGARVGSAPIAGLTEDALVRMMVGRELGSARRAASARQAGEAPALEVRGLSAPPKLSGIDLTVAPGEVVGVAGQSGAGRSSLARALFGLHRHDGEVRIDGKAVAIGGPWDAIRAGVGYVPEDRKGAGLVLTMSVGENLTMPLWKLYRRAGLMDRRRQRAVVERSMRDLRIRAPGPDTSVKSLSGGNQQKVVLARWMAVGPRVLLLDEPTRGIDVGAKGEIYELIERLTRDGLGVLLFSSELPELLRVSDRILVMARGRIVGEQDGDEATEESITAMAFEGLAA